MALLRTNTGIGTTNPTSALHVIGDVLVTGVVTSTTFNGNINAGVATITTATITNLTNTRLTSGVGTITNLNNTFLNVSGVGSIATLNAPVGNINIGIITGLTNTRFTSGIATITNLISTASTITDLTNTRLTSGVGTITNLTGTNATLTRIDSTHINAGILTATQLSTGAVGSSINITSDSITGPSSIVIDPAGVGDNTGAVRIKGDLYVDGNQFVVNSSTIELADLRVGIATTVGSNMLLDGGGIGIGSTNILKTFTYNYASDSLKSSENLDINSGKTYKVNGTDVLSNNTLGSGVIYSSLQYLGTLNNLNVSGLSTLPTLVGTYATITEITNTRFSSGITTITDLTVTNSAFTNLNVNNLYAVTGIVTDISGTRLNYTGVGTITTFDSDTATINNVTSDYNNTGVGTIGILNSGIGTINNLNNTLLNVSGVGTIPTLNSTNATLTNINSTGISTLSDIRSERVTVSGIVTANSFRPSSGYIQAADGTNSFYIYNSTGNVAFQGTIGVNQINNASGFQVLTFNNLDTRLTGNLNIAGVTTSSVFNGNIYSLGVSTFRNGPVLIGTGSSTGTTFQPLQVTGGGYISGNLGIGETNPTSKLQVTGDTLVTGVITATSFNGNINSGVGTITTFDSDTATINNVTSDYNNTGVGTIGILNSGIGTITNLNNTFLNVSGVGSIATLYSPTANINVGVVTNLTNTRLTSGIGTINNLTSNFNSTGIGTINIFNSGIGTITTFDSDTATINNVTSDYNNTGVGTIGILNSGIGTITNLNNTFLNVSGVGSIATLNSSVGNINVGIITNLTNTRLTSGIGTITTLDSTHTNLININSTGISTLNIVRASTLQVSGVSTFIGGITGTISTATKLETARTFEITGDVVASPILFDGTGNVSLAATIQPNSVGLGTDTFGDYVRDITGTSNQITVTGGTGEGSTPIISLPNNLVVPQDLTVARDLQVNRNLNVTGSVTIGGTSALIYATELTVSDPDIVLGFRTDANNNDVSNDNTANHGGVAIASTEGTPLTQLFIAGIETNPATYKKIMWFKGGTFSGLGTDAWLINYAVGIGSTQFPTGTRLAAGSVQFTENDLAVVRNINASGILTVTTANIVEGNITSLSGTRLNYTGVGTITTLNSSTGTINNLTSNYNNTGVGTIGILNSGIGTIANLNNTFLNVSGVGTIVTLNSTTGTVNFLSGTNLNYSGITTLAITSVTNLTSQSINNSGITTTNTLNIGATQVISATRQLQNIASLDAVTTATIESAIQNAPNTFTDLQVTGITTLGITSATNLTAQQLNVSGDTLVTGIVTAIGGFNLGIQSGGTNITTGVVTALNFVGAGNSFIYNIATKTVDINIGGGQWTYADTSNTATSSIYRVNGNVGLGTTNPTSKLTVIGDGLFTGVVTATTFIGQVNSGVGTITTLSSANATLTNINSSGVSTLGIVTASQLYVSGVSTFQGNVQIGDNDNLYLGDGNDLRIFHNGANSFIQDNGTGNLFIDASNTYYRATTHLIQNPSSSETLAVFTSNGSVELYYDNSKKFETSGVGATVYGTLDATQLNVSGVGTIPTFNSTNTNLTNINSSGISTLTDARLSRLVVSGVTTTTTLNVGTGGTVITTTLGPTRVGINSTAPLYTLDVNGDINFRGNLFNNGSSFVSGIGIRSDSTIITGTGTTILNFVGTAVSSITADIASGIATIFLERGQFTRTTTAFTATTNQTTFTINYTPGYIDVYVNGVRLTSSEYTAINGTSIVLATPCFGGETVDITVFQDDGLYSGSKWTPGNGNNIYRLNGNVGIGTDNITSKLTVNGDALFIGIVTATGFNGSNATFTNLNVSGVTTSLNLNATNSTLTNINSSGIATVTNLNVTNEYVSGISTIVRLNVGVAGTVITTTSDGRIGLSSTSPNSVLDIEGNLGVETTVTTVASTSTSTIDSMSSSVFRSARFQVQITQGSSYQSSDIMVVHDGTNASLVEYGTVATGDYLGSFSASVSGGSLLLQVSMTSATSATVKVVRYGITV